MLGLSVEETQEEKLVWVPEQLGCLGQKKGWGLISGFVVLHFSPWDGGVCVGSGECYME